MQANSNAFCGSATSLEVRYTDKPVSGWGGLVTVMRYLEKRGVGEVLTQAVAGRPHLPNQIPGTRHCVDVLGDGADRRAGASRTWSSCAATQ